MGFLNSNSLLASVVRSGPILAAFIFAIARANANRPFMPARARTATSGAALGLIAEIASIGLYQYFFNSRLSRFRYNYNAYSLLQFGITIAQAIAVGLIVKAVFMKEAPNASMGQFGYGQQPYGTFPQTPYAQPGFPQSGFPQPGFPQPGFPQPGPQAGYGQPGFPPQPFPQAGFPQPGSSEPEFPPRPE
jgi:hypothetical protein